MVKKNKDNFCNSKKMKAVAHLLYYDADNKQLSHTLQRVKIRVSEYSWSVHIPFPSDYISDFGSATNCQMERRKDRSSICVCLF